MAGGSTAARLGLVQALSLGNGELSHGVNQRLQSRRLLHSSYFSTASGQAGAGASAPFWGLISYGMRRPASPES